MASTRLLDEPVSGGSGGRSIRPGLWKVSKRLSAGMVAGAALGAAARGWMRLITDHPEFSWNGTIFIVVAFALAGLGHGIAATSRGLRRRWSSLGRATGAVLTLPLFIGAGAMMLPTVAGGALAVWRADWPRWSRALAAVIALPIPVILVVDNLTGDRLLGRVAGVVLMTVTYAIVVRSVGAVAAPLDDGWAWQRRRRNCAGHPSVPH